MLTDPYAIFAAAQQRWLSAAYPSHVTYGIAVSVSKNGLTLQAHYHAVYDSAQNRVTLNAVSDEELAHPYTPQGVKLGVPVLAPNYSFGIVSNAPPNTVPSDADLVRQIRAQFHDPPLPRKPPASSEMWIDTSTYVTDRIVTGADFTAAELGGVRWQSDFVQVAGATFIDSETALAGFTLERRHYDSASVAFTNITAVQGGAPYATLPRFATSSDTAPPVLSEPLKPRS